VTLPPGAIRSIEILALVAGLAYVVLAARRNRLCWIAGALSSACMALVAGVRYLPMQSALNVFYVGMSAYGWWNWTRSTREGQLTVGLWPFKGHLVAALVLIALTYASAAILAAETQAAWPLLDSLTTSFSLFATWLTAKAKLENWLYWIAIDGVLVFLFYVQDLPYLALLNVLLIGIAGAGFVAWRRRYRAQQGAA
jgi:nicotinamide mononucleotide transporter